MWLCKHNQRQPGNRTWDSDLCFHQQLATGMRSEGITKDADALHHLSLGIRCQ